MDPCGHLPGINGSLATIALGILVLAGGCAGTTQNTGAFGIYWDASRECESRYRSLRVHRIDVNGDLTVSADLDLPSELAAFTRCYREQIQQGAARWQQAGQALPETFNQSPTVEID
jgi:hypothetical protein